MKVIKQIFKTNYLKEKQTDHDKQIKLNKIISTNNLVNLDLELRQIEHNLKTTKKKGYNPDNNHKHKYKKHNHFYKRMVC